MLYPGVYIRRALFRTMHNITSAMRCATGEMIYPHRAILQYGLCIDASSVHKMHSCRNEIATLSCPPKQMLHMRTLRIVHRITKVELGSTPAICLATALRQSNGEHFRSESLDRVARHASHPKSGVVHRALCFFCSIVPLCAHFCVCLFVCTLL